MKLMSCIGGTLGALESSRVSPPPILCRVFLAYLGLGKKRAMRDGANLRVFFSVVLVTVFKGAISLSFGWGGEVSGQKEFGIS